MTAIVTGADYVAALEARPSDRQARRTFQSLALSLTAPGDSVFDFGCGPGIDARFYAEHGLRVGAYDVDPGMCDYFRVHCAAPLQSGDIQLQTRSYADFLAVDLPGFTRAVTLITANFAPLNLAADPRALFTRFARMLVPGGRVLASVLNPLHRGDWHRGWWWRHLPRLALRGEYAVAGAQAPITRYTPQHLLALAGPGFSLEAVHADHAEESSPGLPRRLRGPWFTVDSRYLFLQFRLAPA